MFDHLSTRASDRAATEAFYDAVLPPLGVLGRHPGKHSTLFGDFELSVWQASDGRPVTRGMHLGLRAPSREAVDAFWQAGIAAGHPSDGEPGERSYAPGYYGAFLRDPDGNSIEACLHERLRPRGLIDHAWLGAADLAGQRTFLALLAEHAELEIVADEPDLVRVRGRRGGSLTLTTRPVGTDGAARAATVGLHLAIPAPRATIDAWHAAAVAAGHTDDGAPGPRGYHPGYYGAFVLDPAGLSYELVDHDGVLGERW